MQDELSWLLTDNQVSDIILKHLERKDYRQAAQVIESFNGRLLADGNPDFFLSLWNDQQFGFNQVFIVYSTYGNSPSHIIYQHF